MTFTARALYQRGHAAHPAIVATDADVDALVDALLAGDWTTSLANLYIRERPLNAAGVPDHELGVGVDAGRGVGGLWFMGTGGSWYTRGDRGDVDEVVYYYMGSDTEFPIDSQIPLDLLRRAVKEFLATGGHRPTCVHWQPCPPAGDAPPQAPDAPGTRA